MDEFSLIARIVARLGERVDSPRVILGPGDDAAVVQILPGHEIVSSIDTLVADRHFPANAPADLVGYRAIMVSVSDLAAMAATPCFVTVALSLENTDLEWVEQLADGIADACQETGVAIVGGNIARGPLSLTVSAQGECPTGQALRRDGARVGQRIQVSGVLGGAASCVRNGHFEVQGDLKPDQDRYYRPRARVDLIDNIRGVASAGIDISDGLVQDLAHVLRASSVGAHLEAARVPLHASANMADGLWGGDDYELLICADEALEGFVTIGTVTEGTEVLLDNRPVRKVVPGDGYDHFRA